MFDSVKFSPEIEAILVCKDSFPVSASFPHSPRAVAGMVTASAGSGLVDPSESKNVI